MGVSTRRGDALRGGTRADPPLRLDGKFGRSPTAANPSPPADQCVTPQGSCEVPRRRLRAALRPGGGRRHRSETAASRISGSPSSAIPNFITRSWRPQTSDTGTATRRSSSSGIRFVPSVRRRAWLGGVPSAASPVRSGSRAMLSSAHPSGPEPDVRRRRSPPASSAQW